MYRLIIAILSIFAVVGAVNAANYTAGYVNGSSSTGNASMITVNVNNSYAQAVSQQAVYAAETYLIAKLGQSYYNNHISYTYGQAYGNTSYTYFTYNVPFQNGTNAHGIIGGPAPVERLLGITVSLSGAVVTGYVGPLKPYVITVSQSQAITTAQNYGITNGTASIEGVFMANAVNQNSQYAIAWAVTSSSSLKGNMHPGVYIDSENGTVLGEYVYNPAILSASGYGYAGNFSMYYSGNQSKSKQPPSHDSQYIVPLTILAFIILGAGLYFSRKGK